MSGVRFCPFCKEAFEGTESCPEHGLRLVTLQELPKPQRELRLTASLPRWELRYGRGWVMAGAILSLIAFLLPLAELRGGVEASSTLYALASGRAKTLWLIPMAACAQLLIIARRRSIADLLGARLSIVWLAMLPMVVVALTLVGVYDAAATMSQRAPEPVMVAIGAGTVLVALSSVLSVWGGLRLGKMPTPQQTRVETVD